MQYKVLSLHASSISYCTTFIIQKEVKHNAKKHILRLSSVYHDVAHQETELSCHYSITWHKTTYASWWGNTNITQASLALKMTFAIERLLNILEEIFKYICAEIVVKVKWIPCDNFNNLTYTRTLWHTQLNKEKQDFGGLCFMLLVISGSVNKVVVGVTQ